MGNMSSVNEHPKEGADESVMDVDVDLESAASAIKRKVSEISEMTDSPNGNEVETLEPPRKKICRIPPVESRIKFIANSCSTCARDPKEQSEAGIRIALMTCAETIADIVSAHEKYDAGRLIHAMDLLKEVHTSAYASIALPYL